MKKWILFCGYNAQILQKNEDGTFKVQYWMREPLKGATFICEAATANLITFN